MEPVAAFLHKFPELCLFLSIVIGLVAGWARSRYPVFGSIPEPAQRLLMDIGLIVFIAVVGLNAGPHAVAAYRESGGIFFASIFVAGMIVTLMPLSGGHDRRAAGCG